MEIWNDQWRSITTQVTLNKVKAMVIEITYASKDCTEVLGIDSRVQLCELESSYYVFSWITCSWDSAF